MVVRLLFLVILWYNYCSKEIFGWQSVIGICSAEKKEFNMAKKKGTTAGKLGDKSRVAADWLKQKRDGITKWEVPDTAHYDEIIKDKKIDLDKLGTWLVENAEFGAKLSGISLLWMLEYLVRTLNVLVVDNRVLRGMEGKFAAVKEKKPGKSKWSKLWRKIQKISKNNPWFMSYVLYYLMLAGITVGGVTGVQAITDKDEDKAKQKIEAIEVDNEQIVQPREEEQVQEDVEEDQAVPEKARIQSSDFIQVHQSVEHINVTFDARVVDPNLPKPKYVEAALETYWPEIAVGLTELETYRETSVRHGRESRETNGLGNTWHYYYDAGGELHQYPNKLGETKRWSKDKNYNQCQRHLLFETLPKLREVSRGKSNIGAQQAVALVLVGYQRTADMQGIANRISSATTVQQVADAFSYYQGASQWREGTLKRRWICAAYAVGAISAHDLLSMDRDAFSVVNINSVYRNGHFLLGDQTVRYVLGRTRSSTESVGNFLGGFASGREILAEITDVSGLPGFSMYTDEQQQQQMRIVEASMKLMNDGDAAFKKGRYADAASLYKQAIDADPDNMQAYSSLAFAYKKLGDKHKSVSYYKMSAQAVVDGNARMNSNKSLLLDRDIKASSYYNAGTAREEIGKIYEEQGKRAEAIKGYEKALQNYKTALENAEMAELSKVRKDQYQQAISRVQKKIAAMKGVAMNRGVKILRKQNARKDLLLYGVSTDVKQA